MATDRDDHAEPIDLASIGLGSDPARRESFVRRVMVAAAPELARRRQQASPWGLIMSWRRPLLAGAGLAAAIAAVVLLAWSSPVRTETTLDEVAGVPRGWVPWTYAERNPSPGELLLLWEGAE
ncbi:hypothetical protein KDM41_06740 [bacterium]|nr:hypothetical protein [bacterium]